MDCLPQIHVAAIHAQRGYHGFTPGLGVMCRDKYLLGAGVYRNSKGDTSTYAAAGYQPWKLGDWKLGAIAGLATGYRPYAVPIAAVLLTYGDLQLALVPPLKGKTPATLGISFTWN